MSDLGSVSFLGVRLLIWIFFGMSIICGLIVFAYWKREVIKEKYYKIRFPEKVIKIIIHYKGTFLYKTYWRLIPNRVDFSLDGKRYNYNDQEIIKENDFYAVTKDKILVVKVDGKIYNLDDKYKINKHRNESYPELHYFDNCPFPISYNDFTTSLNLDGTSKLNIMVSAKDYETLSEQDMWNKLLALKGEKMGFIVLMIIGFLNLVLSGFTLAKLMGWIK